MEIFAKVTDVFDDFDLSITNCDASDMITEISRFMYHIVLIHIITHVVDRKDEFFGQQLFKTLFVTACAVFVYHAIFKKFMAAKLKNMQSVCNVNKQLEKNNKTIEESNNESKI